MEISESKHLLKCDFCHQPIKIVEKGKSSDKEAEKAKKLEPVPLEAILPDPNSPGSTHSKEFCDQYCLRDYLNEKYPKVKGKSKSKASIVLNPFDVEVKTYKNY